MVKPKKVVKALWVVSVALVALSMIAFTIFPIFL